VASVLSKTQIFSRPAQHVSSLGCQVASHRKCMKEKTDKIRDFRIKPEGSTPIKVKVKLSPCVTKYQGMKTYWGMEVWLHTLTSALDGGEWSASQLGRFTPDTLWIRGWMGPRAGLNAVARRKIPCPGRPASSLVTILPACRLVGSIP